jgi:hypothetical protein
MDPGFCEKGMDFQDLFACFPIGETTPAEIGERREFPVIPDANKEIKSVDVAFIQNGIRFCLN